MRTRFSQSFDSMALNAFVSVPLACMLALLVACGDDSSEGEDGGSMSPDAGDGDGDGDGDDEDAGKSGCSVHADCDDGLKCNGNERCVKRDCQHGEPIECPTSHPCIEPEGSCDCRDDDADNDGVPATICLKPGEGGGDCDDDKPAIHPGEDVEFCDHSGVDEDCDPGTFNGVDDGDRDGDTFVSAACFNVDARGVPRGGDDCDDERDWIYPDAEEKCDGKDNDCDQLVDEGPDESGSFVEYGLRLKFYPDLDRDGFGNYGADPILACPGFEPVDVVLATQPSDCNDQPESALNAVKINPLADELCDGIDNDCDGKIDAADDDLRREHDIFDTDFACEEGEWRITHCPDDLLWCPPHEVRFGCTLDATSIDHCRRCDRQCTFACGVEACDEVEGLALGALHTCAITRDGSVSCWGQGGEGRLGNETARSSSVPTLVTGISDAQGIAAGERVTCAVRDAEARELWCWGDNVDGLLGNGDPRDGFSDIPLPVAGALGETVFGETSSIAIGSRHACATKETGQLYCWGITDSGRLGIGSTPFASVPGPQITVRADTSWVSDADQVVVGEQHSCIITFSGTVECWGDNTAGQLGDAYLEELSEVVQPVPGLDNVEAIAAGANHTCAVRAGKVLCWGNNERYQLGREPDDNDGIPLEVEGLADVESIAAGPSFTCALKSDGTVWCWGGNEAGERGDSDVDAEDTPVPGQVMIEGATRLSAGAVHACALTADGVMCWGGNLLGALGNGSTTRDPQYLPSAIQPLKR